MSPTAQRLGVARAEVARRRLIEFVEQAWPIVQPGVEYKRNWHIDAICSVLEAVSRGEVTRVIINIPPGCSKSLTVSVFWPAWEWASDPGLGYLCASYGMHLAVRDNLALRSIVESPWYRQCFWNERLARDFGVATVRLRGDQNEKVRFDTTAKGWRIGTSVGGVGTGEHPNRKIIDDALTAEQARSEADRDRVWAWYKQTMSSRGVAKDAPTVLVGQRLHEDDLHGRILNSKGASAWTHVMLPMRFEPARACALDQRKQAGELLWPSLFPEHKVRELEMDLAEYGTAGQLQQRPAPEGGGLFKREWFGIVDALPQGGIFCRGWDTAATEGGGDWTAGVKMVRIGATFFVVDVVRGQWGPAGVEEIMAQCAVADGRGCRVREEREGGASGKTVIADRTKTLVGFDFAGVAVSADKVMRARPFRTQAEAGNVKLLRGEWIAAYLAELTTFPTGRHDDQVDASSCAFNELALGPGALKMVEVKWG